MKLLQEKLSYKNIETLIVNEIDIDDRKHINVITSILKELNFGEKYYFELINADTFFCPDNLLEHYKNYLPELIKKRGKYVVKDYRDDTKFKSIATLSLSDKVLLEFEHIWRYYDGVLFFNPNNLLTWDQFNSICFNLKPDFYGIGYIKNGFTDMTFVRGHDGDNLIITYDKNKFDTDKIRKNIERIIEV